MDKRCIAENADHRRINSNERPFKGDLPKKDQNFILNRKLWLNYYLANDTEHYASEYLFSMFA